LFEALDTNHDGVISASEMENAPASLRTLLKNGQTQLTREDLRPAHGPQQRPPDAE
jgi:Ca2+-binding EF-hand superfamily protein